MFNLFWISDLHFLSYNYNVIFPISAQYFLIYVVVLSQKMVFCFHKHQQLCKKYVSGDLIQNEELTQCPISSKAA